MTQFLLVLVIGVLALGSRAWGVEGGVRLVQTQTSSDDESFKSRSAPSSAEDGADHGPKFGLENELRDPVSSLFVTFNPLAVSILLLAHHALGSPIASVESHANTLSALSYFGLFGSLFSPAWMSRGVVFLQKHSSPSNVDVDANKSIISNRETGFWLQYGTDPFVIEVRSKPATVADLEANREFIDGTMFDPKRTLGARPAWLLGSGHMHMDLETGFQGDTQLLRDFVVDMLMHPEIYRGPWAGDRFTTWNLGRYAKSILTVIRAHDEGQFRDFNSFVSALRKAGLSRFPTSGNGLVLSDEFNTIELRFLRAQRSTQEIINFATLFRERVRYLREHPHVQYVAPPKFMTPAEAYRRLELYVTETGREWAEYKKMLPAWWRWIVAPLVEYKRKTFVRKGSQFVQTSEVLSCAAVFGG
jgi:hypothetical protein